MTIYTLQKSNATSLLDGTCIAICLWVYIRHVGYHVKACLFVFPLLPYLFWLIHCNMHRVSKLGAMSRIKCCKIAPIFEIQHDVLFRRISVRQLRTTAIPPSYSPIKLCNFSFWALPPIYSPYTCPSETIITNKASIERQIKELSSDI